MRNPFRRRYPAMRSHELWQPSSFGDAQFTRRALAAHYQRDPSPEAGEKFWKLAMPDIEAGFWVTRREIHAQNGWT